MFKISNKNGRIGQTIQQESLHKNHCPVKALTCRISHILANGGTSNTLLCMYKDNTTESTVMPMDMIQSIRASMKCLKLHKAGIDPNIVGVHSLHAGGSHGIEVTWRIRHNSREARQMVWAIHNQIGYLSKDLLSKKMAISIAFTNTVSIQRH